MFFFFLFVSACLTMDLNVSPDHMTVSGLSAGAFFAVQMQFAYSANITGAAIIAGGPYYCAQGQMTTAVTACMSVPMMIQVDTLVSDTKKFANNGEIDDTDNISKQKVYVYSGTGDTVVNPEVPKKLVSMYEAFGNTPTTKFDIDSQHCFITNDYGSSCTTLGSPYICNCDYEQANDFLGMFYDFKNITTPSGFDTNNVFTFDQSGDYSAKSFDSKGYAYVPTSCQKGEKCQLHVSFHGCQQGAADVGTDYVEHTGIAAWAEANEIVVLYPQVKKGLLTNPEGCFDWWGYAGSDYYAKSGSQMKAVYNMMMDTISNKIPLKQ